jgi:hypothetical protein
MINGVSRFWERAGDHDRHMRPIRNRTEADQRHRLAVAQTARWAQDAADGGHYQDALSWMRVLEAVEGELPAELEPLHEHCLAVIHARAHAHEARRRQFVDAA